VPRTAPTHARGLHRSAHGDGAFLLVSSEQKVLTKKRKVVLPTDEAAL
jgi:hypothetical protein